MVLPYNGSWLLYSVGVDAGNHGQIVVSTNTDLANATGWSAPVPVVTDPVPNYPWGNLESPFVVLYDQQYYLFVTRTANDDLDYSRTYVFRSPDPTQFDWDPITEIEAHAAEIVVDNGSYYITSAGWPSYIGQQNRGLSIAHLQWARQ